MNIDIESYMDNIEMSFVCSPVVSQYSVRERDIRQREGYIRIKARLSNGDLFEAFEFVKVSRGNHRSLNLSATVANC